ncbi:MAG: LamG domain-containing protein [Verrucomicrobiota bacterium]
MTFSLTSHTLRSIGLRTGLIGSAFLGGLTAAPETVATVWQLNRIDQIGGLAPEVMGAPKVLIEPAPAIAFNGTSEGLLMPVNPLAGCSQFTVEILISPGSGGGEEQRFFHSEDTAKSRALLELRVLPDGKWCLDSYLRAGKAACVLLDRAKAHPLDRWHWVAMSYDGETLTSYVNGVRELTGKIAFPAMKEGRVSLGVRQNKVSWFKGAIREVRFHPAALAADQLQTVVPGQ